MNINNSNPRNISSVDLNKIQAKGQDPSKVTVERKKIPPSGRENTNLFLIPKEHVQASEQELKDASQPVSLAELRAFLDKKDYEGLKNRVSSLNVNASINHHMMQTVLHRAAMYPPTPENVDLMRHCASKGADFNQFDLFGSTPLLEAIANAQPATALAIAELGREYGIDLNRLPIEADPDDPQHTNHQSALHLLMAKGYRTVSADNQPLPVTYLDVAKKLIDYGADPNIQDDKGNTPLHLAYLRHDNEEIALLLAHGANSDIKNKEGIFPAEMSKKTYEEACAFLKIQAVAYLLDKKTFDAYREIG